MTRKIFINGNVITMDGSLSSATAFGIEMGRFAVVGSEGDVQDWAGNHAETVDLGGKTVIPGIIESHNHMSHFAQNLSKVDCSSSANQTIDEIKERIAERVKTLDKDQWLTGFGFDDTSISDKRHLTRDDLDEVCPNHPAYITHISGHMVYANSLSLKVGGIDENTPQNEGGEFVKDDEGRLTGLLLEPAAFVPLMMHLPPAGISEIKSNLKKAIAYFNENGITTTHDAAISPAEIKGYRALEAEGSLNLRVYLTVLEQYYQGLSNLGLSRGFGSDMLKLGSVKMFHDGSIQILSAALREEYFSKPGHLGDFFQTQDVLNETVDRYHSQGLQVAIHANGDRAIQACIDAIAKAETKTPGQDIRHMIIHCQTVGMDQLAQIKDLPIMPSFFVNHVFYWGDRHKAIFLGPERAARISPLASALKEGITFTLHSDLPVTPVDPIFSMHTAVNRMTENGEILGADQRISQLEALKAYTVNAAKTGFEEDIKGSIEPGKLADFAVLSDDILKVKPEAIKDIKVLKTVLGGDTVFEI